VQWVIDRKSYSPDVKDPPFISIDHVQLAMPAGMEDRARAFYCGFLGMTEIEKPAELKKRGGCWFQSSAVQIHLGVEVEFRPAKKAHPALRCFDYDALTERLRFAGIDTHDDLTIPGVLRCHISDPFGNRIELICA
jgi:catechol 2,3-dioxygenase-like lactoylglutathione lyase family enzyme